MCPVLFVTSPLGCMQRRNDLLHSRALPDISDALGTGFPRTVGTNVALLGNWTTEGRIGGTKHHLLQTTPDLGQQQHHAQIFAFVWDVQDLGLRVLQ